MAPVAEPAADQAAVDAEFVAMVLAEEPWGAALPSPRPTPPRSATRSRRTPRPAPPRAATAHDRGAVRTPPDLARPPDPRVRSPPAVRDRW